MAKESLYGIERRLVFRETFESEESVRRNGGTPSGGSFSNGKIIKGKIVNTTPLSGGIYSVRIKCNPDSFVFRQYLVSFLNSSGLGVGYIRLGSTTGSVESSSGIKYVNGIATSSVVINSDLDIVVTGISLTPYLINIGVDYNDTFRFLNTIELLEIYSGTLTAQEVKNLYENKRHKELNVNTLGRKEILNVSADSGVVRNKYSGEGYNELCPNGGFDTDTIWTKEAGWTISGGTANFDGVASRYIATAAFIITSGKTYKIQFDVKNIVAGSVRCRLGGGGNYGPPRSADGTYTEILTATAYGSLYFYSYAVDTKLSIDNISVKEIIPSVIPTAISLVKQGEVNAMKFNSTTSKILNGSYDPLIGDKTIIAWINPYSAGSGDGRIIDNTKLLFYINSQRIRFTNTGSDVVSGVMGTIPYDRKFKQVVLVRRSTGSADLYINGAYNQTLNGGGTPVAGGDIYIGNNSLNTRWFDGLMNGVRIIDGILTPEEISQLYTNEKDKYGL